MTTKKKTTKRSAPKKKSSTKSLLGGKKVKTGTRKIKTAKGLLKSASSVEIDIPVGTIFSFVGNEGSAPYGWFICDGRSVADDFKSYIALFGKTTPDLRGRVLLGSGTPRDKNNQSDKTSTNFVPDFNFSVGTFGGECRHKIDITEMPKHSHNINGGSFGLYKSSFGGGSGRAPFIENPDRPIPNTSEAGDSSLMRLMQPYYVVNYIIYAGKGKQ